MNTLRGVFSTPKPPKRNFIQENVRQLREMTNYWQTKEGDEQMLQFPQKFNKYMNVPARVPPHVTGAKMVTAKKSPELQNLKSKTRNIKPQPKGLTISKSSPGNKPPKLVKQPRKIRGGVRNKTITTTDESRLREGDVAEYVRKQRETVLSKQQNENDYSDTELSLEGSESDSIEYIKPPISSFNHRSTVGVAHKSTGSQTVDADRLDSIYEEGIIRYPSGVKNGPKQFSANKTISFRNMSQQTERSQTPSVKPPQGVAAREKQSTTLTNVKSEKSNPVGTDLNLELNDSQRGADFVRMNAKAVSAVPSRTPAQSRSDRMKPPPTYQRGIVPRYLQKRQTQWQKDEVQRQHDAPDPTCPPGHVTLPESERKESLKMLRKSYADLVHELNSLPVRADTLRIRQRKMDIEKQLNKLEEGIKVFSRPKVFVRLGD